MTAMYLTKSYKRIESQAIYLLYKNSYFHIILSWRDTAKDKCAKLHEILTSYTERKRNSYGNYIFDNSVI